MKTILMMSLMMLGLSAFARPTIDFSRGFPGRGGGMDRGNVTCRAYDNGWEEHWGGHADCRSCMASHGGCTERCSREEYVCEAEGLRFGRRETYRAVSGSRFRAEDDALRDCRMSRAERCTIKSCNTRSEVVSSRSCR